MSRGDDHDSANFLVLWGYRKLAHSNRAPFPGRVPRCVGPSWTPAMSSSGLNAAHLFFCAYPVVSYEVITVSDSIRWRPFRIGVLCSG